MKARALGAVVAVCFGCAPMLARADTPEPAKAEATKGDALTDVARELYERGLAAYQKNEIDKAYAAFLGAWRLRKHWQIAVNLAASASKLGKFREAAEALTYYLREAPNADAPDTRKEAEVTLADAKEHLTVLQMTVDQAGAEVRVDGAMAGTTPLADPLFLEPGPHTIEVRKDGFATTTDAIAAEAGTEQSRSVSLNRAAPGPRKEIVIAGAAVAGTSLLLGIVTGIAAGVASGDASKQRDALLSQAGDCRRQPPSAACTALEAKRNEQSALTNVAVFSFIGAGAAGIATGAYALLAGRSAPAGPVVAPVVSTSGGGLVVAGHF